VEITVGIDHGVLGLEVAVHDGGFVEIFDG
jgi:hypothetical protein